MVRSEQSNVKIDQVLLPEGVADMNDEQWLRHRTSYVRQLAAAEAAVEAAMDKLEEARKTFPKEITLDGITIDIRFGDTGVSMRARGR